MSRLVKASKILRSSVGIESFLISQGDKKALVVSADTTKLFTPTPHIPKYIYFVEIGQHPFLIQE